MQAIVSITIPTYNRAYLLQRCLSELCRQIEEDELYDQVEIVVSDNYSTDGTEALVNSFVSTRRAKIIYHKNSANVGVIKNILKLVELCTAKYWMFYGDDDIIGPGALKSIIKGFEDHPRYPVFMYRLPEEADDYCKKLTGDKAISYLELASDYFYYVGNAGIFAIEATAAKLAVVEYEALLVKTCWPQTLVIFIAIFRSETKYAKFIDLVSSVPPKDVVIVNNAYYLFETTLYALLRTALFIEQITQEEFVPHAVKSIYGIQNFATLREEILEGYTFYDLPKQKSDLKAALREANTSIPKRFSPEISYLNRYISSPPVVLYLRFYFAYVKKLQWKKLETNIVNKIKIASPFGFNAYMKVKVNEREKKRNDARRLEVDSASGYF